MSVTINHYKIQSLYLVASLFVLLYLSFHQGIHSFTLQQVVDYTEKLIYCVNAFQIDQLMKKHKERLMTLYKGHYFEQLNFAKGNIIPVSTFLCFIFVLGQFYAIAGASKVRPAGQMWPAIQLLLTRIESENALVSHASL